VSFINYIDTKRKYTKFCLLRLAELHYALISGNIFLRKYHYKDQDGAVMFSLLNPQLYNHQNYINSLKWFTSGRRSWANM
jgi:hypothetical protein